MAKRTMELGDQLPKPANRFEDIPAGAFFEFSGNIYKKLNHLVKSNITHMEYNAFNINSGYHESIKGDCPPYYRVYNVKVEYDIIP